MYIGHNNPPPTLAERFAAAMDKLRGLGLTGEVAVSDGVVIIACKNKYDASTYRKAIKLTGAMCIERRPAGKGYLFTIITRAA